MTGPEVVSGDIDMDPELDDGMPRRRSWWGLLAVVLLLLLLMLCVVTTAEVWVSGGKQQARFIARNAECLQCHTDLIPDFSKQSVHSPFATKGCESCHTAHGKKVSVFLSGGGGSVWRRLSTGLQWLPLRLWFRLGGSDATKIGTVPVSAQDARATSKDIKGVDSELILPEDELCWLCHGDLGDKRDDPYQHQPFEASRCTNCHDPHASEYGALLAQAPNKLCFTCHPIGPELDRMQTHPPAKAGWCTNCHDPHASDFKGIIVARQRELCFRCHPSVAVKDSMPVQHVPFLNDNCTGCHEPHGSDNLPLLIAEQPGLCYRCHPSIADQFDKVSHHPVGLELTCASCHDAHAAQYDALLAAKNNDFCYGCHGEFKATFVGSKHDPALCIGCHTPHGSDFKPVLRAANPDVCLRCHEPKDFDEPRPVNDYKNHPVRPTHYDVNAREDLTCTSSCHNPHGTENTKMLRYFSSPSDGSCLICHAASAGRIVGLDF